MLLALVADSSRAPGEALSREADRVRSRTRTDFEHKTAPYPYLLLHISNNQTHIRKKGRERRGGHVNHAYPDWNSIHFSLNLAPIPFFIQIYIPTREYIPTIHSVHVTIQMLLASQ